MNSQRIVKGAALAICQGTLEILEAPEPPALREFVKKHILTWLMIDSHRRHAVSVTFLNRMLDLPGMEPIKKDLGSQIELRTVVFTSLRLASSLIETELKWKTPQSQLAQD